MNWVRGSRFRCMKSSDMKKQKAFFEKKKKQKWLNPQGPPSSPKGSTAANVDLLAMFIANQIALKKAHPDKGMVNLGKPKITHLADSKGSKAYKSLGLQPLELPMSPCAPSGLNLMESEPRYSLQAEGLKKRKPSLLDEFRVQMLSPVMEVNQSDNSSDYLQKHHYPHPHQGPVSSFSLASLSPSAHVSSPSAWEPYCTQTPEWRPFSQADEGCECDVWTIATQPSHFSPAAGAQFRSPLHSTEPSGPSIHPPIEHQERLFLLELNSEEDRDEEVFGERMISINPQATPCLRPYDFSDLHTREYSADFLSQGDETAPAAGSQRWSSERSAVRRVSRGGLRSRGWAGCGRDPEEDQFVPAGPQTDAHGSSSTRDAKTQTPSAPTPARRDASVQCSLLQVETGLSGTSEQASHTHQHSSRSSRNTHACSTRRCHTPSNRGVPSPASGSLSELHTVKWNPPWNTAPKKEPTQQPPGPIRAQQRSRRSEGHAFTNSNQHFVPEQTCFQENAPGNTAVRGGRCEGHEDQSVNAEPAGSARERGGERGVHWVSGEADSLQEIADILLMLKQRNKPE